MKLTVKERLKIGTRRDRYFVGYMRAGNTAYGQVNNTTGNNQWLDPLSLKQAQALLDEMPCAGATIFKLVPVKKNR